MTQIVLAATLLAALAAPVLAQVTPPGLPTWPAQFSLTAGRTKGFGFPITSGGEISVDLRWQGTPVLVELRDAEGKVRGRAETKAPPAAKLTYRLAPEDVRTSMVWFVAVGVPAASAPGSAQATAAGQITIVAPPLDQAKFRAFLEGVTTKRSADGTQLASRTPVADALSAKVAARMKARGDRAAAQQREAQARFEAGVNKASAALDAATRQARAVAAAPVKPPVAKVTAKLAVERPGPRKLPKFPPGVTIQKPRIQKVEPAAARPGDELTLTCVGISDALVGKQVLVTIQPGVVKPAIIVEVVSPPTVPEVYLKVAVPNAEGTALEYNGQVVLQDETGARTDPTPFRFLPVPVPSLQRVTAAKGYAKPGADLMLMGANFGTGSAAYFLFPTNPQSPVRSPAPYVGPAAFSIVQKVPGYAAAQRFVAQVFVRYPYRAKYLEMDVDSAIVPITLDASAPTFSGLGVTEGWPGELITLEGQGFCDVPGKVHFTLPPDFRDVVASKVSWKDSLLLVQIPDAKGFKDPFSSVVSIELADGTRTSGKALGLKPNLETRILDGSRLGNDFTIAKTDAGDNGDTFVMDGGSVFTATHYNSFWHTNEGVDSWFVKYHLKNGWRIAEFIPRHEDSYLAKTWTDRTPEVGTDWPFAMIRYKLEWGCPITLPWKYRFRYIVEGPAGLDY